MEKRRLAEPLILLLLVGVAVAWWQNQASTSQAPQAAAQAAPQVDDGELRARWQGEFNEAQRLLAENRLDEAEPYLLRALDLAKALPANDKAVAETYDDLGQLYYRMGRFEDCELAQGRAVAALALAGGLKAAELRLYISRHNLARNELKASSKEPDPAQFIMDYPPYTGGRLKAELQALLDSDLDGASRQKLTMLADAVHASR